MMEALPGLFMLGFAIALIIFIIGSGVAERHWVKQREIWEEIGKKYEEERKKLKDNKAAEELQKLREVKQ